MDGEEFGSDLKVLDSSLSRIKWRLKSSTKRRLEVDILALSTGMRPVVMFDYGGKLPELQDQLCALLNLCRKESPTFEHMRVMVIQDMIYLTHIRHLAEHARSSLNSEPKLLFVDLEQDPPQMIAQTENSPLAMQLISIQKLFCSVFPPEGTRDRPSSQRSEHAANIESAVHKSVASQSSECIDLSYCMQDKQFTVPTLNGWLLGYPVVYLFSKEHVADAVYNLSTKSLHIFQIFISRNGTPSKGSQLEELLSFSVPYDLSMRGRNEQWAEAFLAHMQAKWERCSHIWRFLCMEVSHCYPQAIAL